jgi:thiamine biosynthesis lipoprotein
MTNKLQNVGKYIAPAVFLCVLGGLMWYQSRQHRSYYNSGYRSVMGTFAQVTVAAGSEEQAQGFITAAFAEMDKVNRIMNDWDPNSEISQLTQTAYPAPKTVSPELFEVIAASVEYSKLSDGAFDITVGPETQLWRQMQKTGQKPSSEELAEARARVGYEKVTLNPSEKTVRFAIEGMKLDVGAIAKGYAVDIAMEAMRAQGAVAGMVDLGGNVRCFGPGPAGGNWYIGLRDPRNP